MKYVIAFCKKQYQDIFSNMSKYSDKEFVIIDSKEALTFENLSDLKPRFIFFPHWSFVIPREIYENFECVIFHMTDVPFGRGGSPLQNLISRGIYETKISALRCLAEIDAGPVYLKRPLSLFGSADEIYLRAGGIIKEMVLEIIGKEIIPIEQEGEVTCFARRKPEDGNMAGLKELSEVFDYIRMLDADSYPNAFLETEYFRLEFTRASLKQGKVIADVMITRMEGKR